ncbi:MAG: extensin family protein [Beijerinckiaceae bacterium]|nr:extensin family protein [Beijerinckiaceae bacterium]
MATPEVLGPPVPPLAQAPPPPPDESACVALFDSGHVRAERSSKPGEKNACAIADGVTLRAVKLTDGKEVSLAGGVTVRCAFAASIAQWVREDVAPRVETDGHALQGLSGIGGLECRTRNHQPNAKISEHARGAALDVRALQTSAGLIDLTKADAGTKALREDMRTSVCARFTTVLGPGSDPFHSDHIHVDMAERRGGYRMCQWNVE